MELKPKEDGVVEETLIFSPDELVSFLNEIHWIIAANGTIIDDHAHPAKCSVCGKPLTKNDFGAFLKGSMEAVCGDFSCFAGAILYRDIRKIRR